MVERRLAGITPEELSLTLRAAIDASERSTTAGQAVRYIRSTFVPESDMCFCLFEAPTRGLVAQVNEAARIPFSRIVEALDLTPEVT